MPRLPPRPALEFTAGAPHSRDHDDVYFSGDGLSEKRLVFLQGCGLPDGWRGRGLFTIGELGFGTGLNLLAAWDLWRRHRPSPDARLNYLSFEGALMSAADAARVHGLWPELAPYAAELIKRWPERARGAQRIFLPDKVTLTLFIDDVKAALPQARGRVDAWFLDGFAPAKNPDMWSAEAMAHLARLSAPGARAASYTVAGEVRRNLEAAGFTIEKKPGFGRKKERLEARLPSPARKSSCEAGASAPDVARTSGPAAFAPAMRASRGAHPDSVLVIGAGIAGACAARAFLNRGCRVTVIDKAPAPGAGASGNPIALVMPRLDAVDTPAARGSIEAWLFARRFYLDLGPDAALALEALHRPRGETEERRFAKLLADPPLDETVLSPVDPANPAAGLRHVGAIAVAPALALARLLDGALLRFNESAQRLKDVDADWVIVCAGMGLAAMEGAPPLEGRLGQIEHAPSSAPPSAVADGGYAVEAFGRLVFGATFEAAHGEPLATAGARAHNLETLARLRPGLAPERLSSRAAIRAATPDRLPVAGPLAHRSAENEKAPDADPAPLPVIRLLGGLGARGFLWAPLLAELLASEAFNEPTPVEADVAKALDPGRFLRRARRRSGG